jgi:hypothetical protein
MLFKRSKREASADSLYRSLNLYNEKDYLNSHPDVAAAVRRGDFQSGFDHFRKSGLAEGRFPGFDGFDHNMYLERNADVADSLKSKNEDMFAAVREHFRRSGYAEGRSWK